MWREHKFKQLFEHKFIWNNFGTVVLPIFRLKPFEIDFKLILVKFWLIKKIEKKIGIEGVSARLVGIILDLIRGH